MKMELRMNPSMMEVNDDGSMTVKGYVNMTEQWSNMLGRTQRFKEKIAKGAFDRAVQNAGEIHFLAEHDNSKILASTRNNSLELHEDEQGLYMKATISPTSWGKDYYQLIKDGILNNMSFGFRAVKDSWRNMGDHFERIVNDLELFEVSVVRDPAYSQSSISARGIDLVSEEVPEEIATNIKYNVDIRSDADVEAIAKKLFEMLQANVKVAEQAQPELTEEVVEETVEQTEEPVVEQTNEVVEEVKEPEVVEEKVEDEQVVEETVVDEQVVEEPVQSGAEKIRDFINKFKEA